MTDIKKQYFLFEIPRESKIYEKTNDGSEYITFKHLDGLYSYCITQNGGVINLAGSLPLKPYRMAIRL
jgi:hypothetical protein